MSGQVLRGSAGEYRADERAGVAGLSMYVHFVVNSQMQTLVTGNLWSYKEKFLSSLIKESSLFLFLLQWVEEIRVAQFKPQEFLY